MKISNLHTALLLLFFLLVSSRYTFAQQPSNDAKLANHYYNKGEFDKAETFYLKLYKKHKTSTYFNRYYECLAFQKKYEIAEKLVDKQIKKDPFNIELKFCQFVIQKTLIFSFRILNISISIKDQEIGSKCVLKKNDHTFWIQCPRHLLKI